MTAPKRLWLSELSRFARLVVCVEFFVAVGAIVYLGLHLTNDVFVGSPAALPVRIEAWCQSSVPASPCTVSIVPLSSGRYRITTDLPANHLNLSLGPQPSIERARALLVRLSAPEALLLEMHSADGAHPVARTQVAGVGFRTVIALPTSHPVLTQVSFVPEVGTKSTPLVLDEVGFFEDSRGLLNDVRPMFAWIPPLTFYRTLVPKAISLLCVFTLIAAFVVPSSILRKLNPILLGLVCFALCILDLAIIFSPYGSHDLRLFYANGPLQEPAGTNLNVGLWQGFRFLQGEGLTFSRGAVPWERMPGYGLFCALAGALFGHGTLLEIATATIVLQVLFYSVALGLFAWAAGLLWSPPAVWTVGLLIALLPKQLGYTQVDSVVAPIALLVMASLCVRLAALRNGRQIPWAADVFVHLAFACWFVMRPDVLPGWLIVSLLLHWRSWRRLLIPAALFLTIGCGWGAYKARYTNEFALTTSSAGASLFCGLWEVPSRFRWTCSDTSYFNWMHEQTSLNPQTRAANSYAIREVFKFWLTFPGHLVVMLDHKMMQCLDGGCWMGLKTYLQEAMFQLVAWPSKAILWLLTIVTLCVAVGYQRRRTLLLAWPLFLNAPLFWVMFASDGRFYSAVPIALLVAAVPPLFEEHFYGRLVARPWRTASVLACAALFAMTAWPFHDWLVRNDRFHYWTPFLDPSKSALSAFK